MKTFKYGLILITVFSLFGLLAPAVIAQEPEPDLQIAKGELVFVDPETRQLKIRDENGEEWGFLFNDATEVTGEIYSSEGLATMQGKTVTVHYTMQGDEAVALKIQVGTPEEDPA